MIYELHAVDENKNDINMLFLLNNVCTLMKIIKCVVCALIKTMCLIWKNILSTVYNIKYVYRYICMCSQQITSNYSIYTMVKGPCLSPVDIWLQTKLRPSRPGSTGWPSSSSLASWRPRCSRSECKKRWGEYQKKNDACVNIPSGKRLHNYGKIHHLSWENSLCLWPFSIAILT